jgi:hypothetical protein
MAGLPCIRPPRSLTRKKSRQYTALFPIKNKLKILSYRLGWQSLSRPLTVGRPRHFWYARIAEKDISIDQDAHNVIVLTLVVTLLVHCDI